MFNQQTFYKQSSFFSHSRIGILFWLHRQRREVEHGLLLPELEQRGAGAGRRVLLRVGAAQVLLPRPQPRPARPGGGRGRRDRDDRRHGRSRRRLPPPRHRPLRLLSLVLILQEEEGH